jgi:hypothetical protein
VKLVVQPAARDHIEAHGGTVYVWAKRLGCCRGRLYVLETDTEAGNREFELAHAADGFQVFTTPGLRQPEELHVELSRGKLQAFWNGQGWIG